MTDSSPINQKQTKQPEAHVQQIKRGKFISFEGIDGAGKSSHIDSVAALIRAQGFSVISTREPGGTPLGEKLRDLLLHETMHLETETLLMFAGRREHLAQVIEPALARGDFVLCDRFTDASYAYQGGGRGLAKEKLASLEAWVHAHLAPDLTFLFDLPISVASERIGAQARQRDRFEQEKSDFHARVRAAYVERAAAASGRIKIIDATQTMAAIRQEIESLVLPYLA